MSAFPEGIVELVLPGGDGLIRQEHENILIPNVMAGDHIQYRISQKRRGAMRGQLLEVLSPSTHRVEAPCTVAMECGGCALQHMDKAEQAKMKTAWVTQAFSRVQNADTKIHALNAEAYTFSGRRRVRWFVDGHTLGFRKRNSHQTVHSQHCIALTDSLNAIRQHLESVLHLFPTGIESIQAVELSNGYHIILESKSKAPPFELPGSPLEKPLQYWWRQLETPSIKPLSKPALNLFDRVSLQTFSERDIDITIGPNDFIQGHQQGNQALIQQILAWSNGSQRIVDLFSGCGNLSLPLAAAFDACIVGAEVNVSSVKAANDNAHRLHLDATYHSVDLFGHFNIEPFIGADTLIIDPPRKGAKKVCAMMQNLFPKQIIMVNCDAAAGARDAQALTQAGFKLRELRPLDLFPYTGHVEVMSLWSL